MKFIMIANCLKCPFSHFTLHENDRNRLHLYCGHCDRTVTKDGAAYDNQIPEWCDLENYYEVDGERHD